MKIIFDFVLNMQFDSLEMSDFLFLKKKTTFRILNNDKINHQKFLELIMSQKKLLINYMKSQELIIKFKTPFEKRERLY